MEFAFRLPSSIGAPPGHPSPYIGCLDDGFFRGMSSNLVTVLDTVGKKSAVAQGLKKPVTYGSASSLIGQRIYLMVDDRRALGFIKVGTKRLFVAPPAVHASRSNHACVQDALKEISPLCVLDFYVHESCQRTGLGRHLFDTMLAGEGTSAVQLAYDRPSPKLLPFLRKHFGLSRYQPQNNNFVIFDEFYSQHKVPADRASRSLSVRRGRSSEAMDDAASRGSRRSGILPYGGISEPPPFQPMQMMPTGHHQAEPSSCPLRPPLMPSAQGSATPVNHRPAESEMFGGNGASNPSSRPPSLCSNSRPPPLAQQGAASALSTLQTPWATAADDGRPGQPGRRNGGHSSSQGVEGGAAAGQYCRSNGRSVSMPVGKGHARTSGENPLTGWGIEALPGLGASNGSAAGCSRRYASPLSHAGSRMLAL